MASYKPISATEFRVVHLLPGSFDDQIRCVLEIRACEVKTQYEALSYQWGAESLAKPTLQLAHLQRRDPEAPTSTNSEVGLRGRLAPPGLQRIVDGLQPLVLRYSARLRICLMIVLALLLSRKLPALLFDLTHVTILKAIPPAWTTALLCVAYGRFTVIACEKATLFTAEVIKTKPWLLVHTLPHFSSSNNQFRASETVDWETVSITPNLERALRYLRLEKQHRTLWIDALCINQQNDEEKKVQIRRMDFLYANASTVRIWLGDYHGIGDSKPCPESAEASDSKSGLCQHQREISDAFGFMRAADGMRILIPSFLYGWSLDRHMEDTMPGLLAIARRGYWQRLWVVQEAALGTGPVHMQCGHDVCSLGGFISAQHRAVIRQNAPQEVKEAFECGRRFAVTWQEFRYSSFHDHGINRRTARLIKRGLTATTRRIFPGIDDEPDSFHERPYPHRLLHVLLRVSGYFSCRDDPDRLYAVLGVVGGVEKGRRLLANAVEYLSSQEFMTVFGLPLDQWLKFKLGDNTGSVVLRSSLGGLAGCWGILFDTYGRYWTINKPQYIVTNHTSHDELSRAIDEATTRAAPGDNGELFYVLAKYLANQTKSLSFLDAVSFDDQPISMASWVPRWQARVDDDTYKFLATRRDGDKRPRDTFRFLDEKTLEIVGMDYGPVEEVRNVEAAVLDPDLWQYGLDKMFVLPSKNRDAFVRLSRAFTPGASDSEFFTAQDELKVLEAVKLVLEAGNSLIARHGSAVLHYSADNGSGIDGGSGSNRRMEPAFIRAGEAKKADRVVFVPGCYHQLVLREVPSAKGGSLLRCKLVGLVITVNVAMNGRTKEGVESAEWVALWKRGELKRFAIV